MNTRFEIVEGKLTSDTGSEIRVRLRLTVQELLGQNPTPDDVTVSWRELIGGNVPDGNYMLEYFYLKRYIEPVRVHSGQLLGQI
jgi:hypothetical protein